MTNSKVSSKDTQRQEESPSAKDGFGAYLDEMSKMKYVDFRKKSVEAFEEIDTGFDIVQDAIRENIKWYAKDRDTYIDDIVERFENIEKLVDRYANGIMKRIENLELHIFVAHTLLKRVRGVSLEPEHQKGLAEMLNVNEEMAQDFMNTITGNQAQDSRHMAKTVPKQFKIAIMCYSGPYLTRSDIFLFSSFPFNTDTYTTATKQMHNTPLTISC
jgi:hypothetical protein